MTKLLGLCAWLCLLGGLGGIFVFWPRDLVDVLGRPVAAGPMDYALPVVSVLSGLVWFALLAGLAETLDHIRAVRSKIAPASDAYRPSTAPLSRPPRPAVREVDVERARTGL